MVLVAMNAGAKRAGRVSTASWTPMSVTGGRASMPCHVATPRETMSAPVREDGPARTATPVSKASAQRPGSIVTLLCGA